MPRKEKMDKKDKDVLEMETGEKDEDIYRATGREELMEEDEISPEEEGFMEGEDKEGENAKCAFCGSPLMEADDVVEEEIDDRVYRFCSNKHAASYLKKKKGKSQLE